MSQLGQDDYPVVGILGQEENEVFSAYFTGILTPSLYHPSYKNHQAGKEVRSPSGQFLPISIVGCSELKLGWQI